MRIHVLSDLHLALWIHGHVHRPSDYALGQTRVVCNPRGYPDEPVSGFADDLLVEIAA